MKRSLRFAPAVLWAALIFLLSHQPDLPGVGLFPGFDKLVHAGFYGVLALLLVLADPEPRRTWIWVAVAALYGVSDELHQAYVPGRSADVADFAADAGGSTLAVAGYRRWRKR